MYTLRQLLHAKGSAGDPLPPVFPTLDQRGTRFLRGQLCLICAGPGTGKSAFVLTYALRAQVPTLYFSADSDAFTQLSRSMSILTGRPLTESMRMVREQRLNGAGDVLDGIPIRFHTEASPTLAMINDSLEAHCQLYGDYPALVVVDNITNVLTVQSEEDPFAGLEMLMDELHKLARDTGACVVGLHHVTGHYNNGDIPIPMGGIKGQIGRVPELILSLHRQKVAFGSETLNVSTIKNRAGRQDPSGQTYVPLSFDGERMQISDPLDIERRQHA